MYFSKKVYGVCNGVWGKAPEDGELSRIFVLKVTLQSVKMGEQDVLFDPPIIWLGEQLLPLLPWFQCLCMY